MSTTSPKHNSWPTARAPERLNRFNIAALTLGRFVSRIDDPAIRELEAAVRHHAVGVVMAKDYEAGQEAFTDVGVDLEKLNQALGKLILSVPPD